MSKTIIIIGAGLAGLSATLTCARAGCNVWLISNLASERAGSVMAEGGINAALNTKGENDSVEEHFKDTFEAGCFIGNEKAIKNMVNAAPDIVKKMHKMGVNFNTDENGNIDLRNFGGQKKKRTAFAKSDTGKQIMTAYIDEVRKYECKGIVKRFSHHSFITLLLDRQENAPACGGCVISDNFTSEQVKLKGDAVIMATGGLHGIFGNTTGSLLDTAFAAAELFRLGVYFENLEFIQYHPTTLESNGKRMLISEAARGEGGRLFADTPNGRVYFMEEKYPTLGNLMPRDITSKEIWRMQKEYPVYLDISFLSDYIIENKLSSVEEDCKTYAGIDVRNEAIPVSPGIHYFMGGIYTDEYHKTNIKNLFAAGECTGLYHGANRLGGNSLLGAVYGGEVAAQSAVNDSDGMTLKTQAELPCDKISESELLKIQKIMLSAMGIERSEKSLENGLNALSEINNSLSVFGKAFIKSALFRKESRGAHCRTDYPETYENYKGSTLTRFYNGEIITEKN